MYNVKITIGLKTENVSGDFVAEGIEWRIWLIDTTWPITQINIIVGQSV